MGRSITFFMNFFFKKNVQGISWLCFIVCSRVGFQLIWKILTWFCIQVEITQFIIGKSEVLSIQNFSGPLVQSINIIIRVFFFHVVFNLKKLNKKVCRNFALQATWKTGMISYVLGNNSVRWFRWPPIGKKWISKYKSP